MLKAGDKLKFTIQMCVTQKPEIKFEVGDILTLVEPTEESPHGFKSKISNWVVDGPNGRSVWSSIYYSIEAGWLKRI